MIPPLRMVTYRFDQGGALEPELQYFHAGVWHTVKHINVMLDYDQYRKDPAETIATARQANWEEDR